MSFRAPGLLAPNRDDAAFDGLSVCLSVYVSVCVLCTSMSFAKTDEPIEMPSVCCSGDVWLLCSILFVWHTYMYTVSQTQKHIFVGV